MNGQMQPPPGQAPNAGAGGFAGPDGNGGGGSGSGRFNTGTVGPLRLFQKELAGQASWLIPFAFLSAIGILINLRRRNFTEAHKEVIFWLAWLVPGMIFFSIAEFFHHYYLIMLAPPIAALTGAGWSKLWDEYRNGRGSFTTWLFPAAIAATAGLQWYMLQPYEAQIGKAWSMGIAAAGALVIVMLIVLKLARHQTALSVAIAGMLILLVAPMYWAATPITYGQNSMLPQAGPGTANMRGGMGGTGGPATAAGAASTRDSRNSQAVPAFAGQGPGQGFGGPGGETAALNETLYRYLKEHNTGEAYLFATVNYNTAAPYIIDKGESVIIMGGFSGNDPAVTTEELAAWVAEGKLKYVLAGGGMGGRGGSTQLTAWLQEHGRVVPAEEWGGTESTGGVDNGNVMFGGGGRFGSMTLYEISLAQGGSAQ
jgi:4-amino-4-deoxy-L-arabinose transferase-like glycosyltransferase